MSDTPDLSTIALNWQNFARLDIPPHAPPVQRQAMEQAFYAGAASIMLVVVRATEAPDPKAALAVLSDELAEFAAASRARVAVRKMMGTA